MDVLIGFDKVTGRPTRVSFEASSFEDERMVRGMYDAISRGRARFQVYDGDEKRIEFHLTLMREAPK